MVLGQASINLKLRQFSSRFLSSSHFTRVSILLCFFPFSFASHINFCFSQLDLIDPLQLSSFFTLKIFACAKLIFNLPSILPYLNFLEAFFKISKLRHVVPRRSASSLDSTSRRLSSTWVVRWRCCQSKSLSVDPNALDCARTPFLLLLFLFLFFARARMLAFKEHRSRF